MMGRKLLCLALALILAAGLTACASPSPQPTTVPEETSTAELDALIALLGLSDQEAAEALGGGEENWTADKSFFIGRIYETTLFDAPVTVYTSYNDEELVASVSAWLTDGTRQVAEEEVDGWVERISDYTGTEPAYDDTTSEVGSRNWKWDKDNVQMTLRWLGDIVTMDFQPLVGEMK